jgi:hypothetical protein
LGDKLTEKRGLWAEEIKEILQSVDPRFGEHIFFYELG